MGAGKEMQRRVGDNCKDATEQGAEDPAPTKKGSSAGVVPEHLKMFQGLYAKLKQLKSKPQLNRDAQNQVDLLFELFDHLERVEKELTVLREKDAALDACIR